jgi:hypothetical protein
MSTLKTINIIHPSGSTNNIVNDSSGNSTVGNNLYVTTNAGIGTTSPGALLEVSAANASVYSAIRMTNTTASGTTPGAGIEWARAGTVKSSITANTYGNDYMAFNVNGNTERMRIDSSGNLLVNTSSFSLTPSQGYTFYNSANSSLGIGHASGSASGNNYMIFSYNGSGIGSISQNSTTGVLYNITSDERLKINIVDAPSAKSIIDDIQIRSFDWKKDNSHNRYGVIAQELFQIVPEAVHAPKNSEEMMGVDYSKLVPILIKYVKELEARIIALEEK